MIAPDGQLMVCGENGHNRLGLDTETKTMDMIDIFTPVLAHLGPIQIMDIGIECSLVLTKSGNVFRVGGHTRYQV